MSAPVTLEDLKQRLIQMEETYLLELLGIRSEDLVERFWDTIELNPEYFMSELEEEEEDE